MRSFHVPSLVLLLLLLAHTALGQEKCGSNTCQADEVCCNESCGICSPSNNNGGPVACTMQYCGPNFPSLDHVCFSGESTVEVEDQGTVAMKDLQVGDRIQTASGSYQMVYAFGHYDPDTPAQYLQIVMSNGQTLEVSAMHLVYVEGSKNPIAAQDIRVGDILQTNDDDGKATVVVQAITEVTRTGLYAPFTTDGTLLVNGIAASSYVSLQEFQSLPSWLQAHTALVSHVALAPYRIYCSMASCQTYNEDGIPHYPALLLRVLQRTAQWNSGLLRWVILGSYLVLATCAWLVESCSSGSALPVLAAASWLVFLVCRRASNKRDGIPQYSR